ncbi:MAG: thiamine-phosphate kinase [Pseudomonadota bacterium]
MSELSEFDRIAQILRPLTGDNPAALNLADDAALIQPKEGHELVTTTDTMVQNIHFLTGEPPDRLASKLLRVNVSDLAAMGAEPFAYMLTTALPRDFGDAWLVDFAKGLAADQKSYGMDLIGGDSVSTTGLLTVSVTAFGYVESGRALRRNGARPGDGLYVTGTVGDAVLGLDLLRRRQIDGLRDEDVDFLTGRYHLPTPRLEIGRRLVGVAGAVMDLSDGLAGDLDHICSASGVGATVVAERVPYSPAARRRMDLRPDLAGMALAGGDDYELLFTVSTQHESALASVRAEFGVPITRIGAIVAGSAARFIDELGREITGLAGWRHF